MRPDGASAKAVAVGALAALGSQLGLLFVVLVVGVQFLPDENTGTFGDWLLAAVWVAGLALRGTLGLSLEDEGQSWASEQVAGHGEIGLTLQSLLLTGTALFAVWWFARRGERRLAADTWARVAGRSATGALVYALAMTVLAPATHASAVFGMDTGELESTSVDLGLALWPLVPYTLVFVFLADLAARAAVRRGDLVLPDPYAERLRGWREPFSAVGTVSVVLLGAGALTAVGYAALGDTDDLSAGAVVSVSLLTLVNAAVWLAGVGMGVTIGATLDGAVGIDSFFGSGSTRALEDSKSGLLTGGMPWGAYLLLPAVVLTVVVVAVRYALARDPRERLLGMLWKFAVAMAVVWLPLSLVSTVGGTVEGDVSSGGGFGGASGSAQGSVSVGLSFFGTLFLSLLWGASLVVAAQFLTRPLLSVFPGAGARVLRLPGRPVHPQWAALLADAARRKGRPVPVRLEAALTEPMTCPPLAAGTKWARFTGVALIAAVVLGAGGTTAWAVVDSQVYGPESAAEDYFEALAGGRAGDVLDLLEGSPSGPLLTQAVLDRQRKAAPVTDVSVDEVEESDGAAGVTVTYRVDGEEYETVLHLVADEEDRHLGLWPRWKVLGGLGQVEVTAASLVGKAQVNGVEVALEDGAAEVVVFPGAVTVDGVSSRYVAANGGGTVVVEPDESESVDELRAGLTGKGERAAQQAVLTELAECVERSTSLEPDDCPISPDGYYWEEDAEDVVWKQKSEPVLQTELADDGTVSVSGDLDLKVTWTDVGYDEEEKMEDTCTSSLSATVDLSGTTPSVSFDESY
ncbi:hypothetical protein ACIQUW_14195 [Streptomyces sp. NPDC101117]|uniref:hypothetical protein n=1 Tax=Streptomyces sp. NPDC101117 TaxID=3366108 RepID=UPI00382EA72F